jgi:hypothetical protein
MKEAKQLLEWADDPDNIDFSGKEKIGSYLQWVPSKRLDSIGWDGNEKFYEYEKWMQFVCDWLINLGIVANGDLFWSGESTIDTGILSVKANHVLRTPTMQQVNDFKPISLSDLEKRALELVTQE